MKGGKNMPGFVAKEGYYPFVGIFNWDFTVDEAAGARFEEAFVQGLRRGFHAGFLSDRRTLLGPEWIHQVSGGP
jgi:hypothetical protein